MIDPDNEKYICDYCKGENGEFDDLTGNHPDCEIIGKLRARLTRAIELLRAVNKTGGVVVEYYPASGNSRRPLRDWITEYLNEVDGKDAK